jgi:hypothetical protein
MSRYRIDDVVVTPKQVVPEPGTLGLLWGLPRCSRPLAAARNHDTHRYLCRITGYCL